METDEPKLTTKDREEIEPIYNEEKLDFETIKKNPILKPVAEMNNSYINFELLINRALWEYGQDKEAIDKMIEANPKYSETIILGKIQSILSHVKQIIHSQDIQKENMKKTINEIIKIVKENYGLLEEEETEPSESLKEPEEVIEKDDNKEEKFYSDLVEKDVSAPKDKPNQNKFIPINAK